MVMNAEKLTVDEYSKYFKHFNPTCLIPKRGRKLRAKPGMKYFVITTKHHEGFCLMGHGSTPI
jgi:alpha-L-fucosidase